MEAHRRYICMFVITLLFLAFFGMVIRKPTLIWLHTATKEDAFLDRRTEVTGIDADILFVGDSSLIFGVIPERIEFTTGMTSYNLGTSVWGFVAAGNAILDDYLTKNRAPRLVVLYLAPWVRVNPPYSYKMEWNIAARMVLAHGSVVDLVRLFALHPKAYFPFLQDVWNRLIFGFHLNVDAVDEALSTLKRGRGWVSGDSPLVGTWRGMKDGCAKPKFLVAPDTAYINEFRRRLTARGLKVAVYIAPTPDCDPSDTGTRTAYIGIADDNPYQLPPRYFLDDGYYAHLFRKGAEENTDRVAEFVLHYLGRERPVKVERRHLSSESEPSTSTPK